MRSSYKQIVKLFLFLIIFLFLVTGLPAFASTYGSGTYGSSLYGGATPTPQVSLQSNSNSTGVASCSAISPIFAPDLYQINSLSTQSILYFAPIYGQYTGYIIDYGYDTNSEQFSTILNTNFSSGAIQFQVNLLNPNTTYSFKVRALNNCVAGPWSNIITIKTSPMGSTRQSINYKASVTFINNSIKINHNGKTILTIPVPFTKQPDQNNIVPPQTNSIVPTSTPLPPVNNPTPPPSSSGNWFSNIISSIKGLFGF